MSQRFLRSLRSVEMTIRWLNVKSRSVDVEHVEKVVDSHAVEGALDEWGVLALFRLKAIVMYLVFQEIVKLLEDLVVQIPAEIIVAVGEEVEDVLAVFASNAVEVIGHDVARQSERVEVGDEFALVLERQRTHSVVVDFELAANARTMFFVIEIFRFFRVVFARKTHVKIVVFMLHFRDFSFLKCKNTKKNERRMKIFCIFTSLKINKVNKRENL